MRKPFCFAAIVPAVVLIMNSVSPAQGPSTQSVSATRDSAVSASLAKANNQFAIDLLHKLSTRASENAFFSPYSVSAALAMTWAGARTETADQMAKVLHFSDLQRANVTGSFHGLQQSLEQTQQQTGALLSIANSLWPQKEPEHPFLPEYLKQVQQDFGSSVQPMDYRSNTEQARQEINRWVEDKTHEKIKDLLHQGDVDGMTRLALVNAIYFKAPWFDPFSEGATADEQFHLGSGATKPVRLMRTTRSERYVEEAIDGSSVQILALPYCDANLRGGVSGLSFVAILPKEPTGLAAVEKGLTAEKLSDWLGEMKSTRVQLLLPKFKLEARYSLGESLQEMGIKNAFIDPVSHPQDPNRADFSGMNGVRTLYISKAIHQTFLDVDEKGTEAAAATGITMRVGAAPGRPSEPVVFRADHPFLFLIRDDATGSILFLGRLSDPPALSSSAPGR